MCMCYFKFQKRFRRKKNMLDLLGAESYLFQKEWKVLLFVQKKLCNKVELAVMTCQFDNKVNSNLIKTTARKYKIRLFCFWSRHWRYYSWCRRSAKRKCPQIKVIAVEPWKPSVLSGKQVKPHIIQGIGFGFVPSVLA